MKRLKDAHANAGVHAVNGETSVERIRGEINKRKETREKAVRESKWEF